MQKAAQVYAKQSERLKSHSAAMQSAPRSSQGRAQTSKKPSGSKDVKPKSSYSQLHSVRKGSECLSAASQRRAQGTVSVGGKAMHGGAGGSGKRVRTRPEWCSVAQDNLAQSEEDEVPELPCVSHFPRAQGDQGLACKETGLPTKEDKMKGHFRISESG